MISTIRRAAVATAALALGVTGTAAGVTSAHADDHHWEQDGVTCRTTSAGRACVALDVETASPQWRAVFSLRPNAGSAMTPVSWTTLNPAFAGTDHRFCSSSCTKFSAWTGFGGNMTVNSVIEFTYNVPGHSEHIYAGFGDLVAKASYGETTLNVKSEYFVSDTGVLSLDNDVFLDNSRDPSGYVPFAARVFGADNGTLATESGSRAGRFETETPLSQVARPAGVAVSFTHDGAKHTLVIHDRA